MKIPSATYRLQFNAAFDFKKASAIAGYLHALGVSDIYASPIFRAKKGSLHGYDVVDPNHLNPELGTEEDFEALIRELKHHDLGWVQDVVPNHMAFDGENQMLMNVLENGRNSEYFDFFDIEWNHSYEGLRGRLLAPFLGKFYGEALETGEIYLCYDDSGLTINYYGLRFPLRIESYANLFTHRLNKLKNRLGRDHPDFIKLLGALYVLKNLSTVEGIQELYDQIQFVKRVLWETYSRNIVIKTFVDENVKSFNGDKGNPDSFKLLDDLLSEQLFRLSYWRVATQEINYRRFFNINDLISLRTEDENVFNRTHALILDLVRKGKITGLRIDHIDGLYDPTKYLRDLRAQTGNTYLVVEKILTLDEKLPSFWAAQGTTGYDYLNLVNGIFCNQAKESAFDRIYSKFKGFDTSYEDLWYQKKKLIIERQMTGDVNNLAHLLKRTLSIDRYGRDITLYALRRAIIEVMACFPVYRTYVSYEFFDDRDRRYIKESVEKALKRNPSLFHELNFIERVLLLNFSEYFTDEDKNEWVHFVMRFQQFTGPLMAKGFEDTTLYIYNRLLSLNDVAGSPNIFGISTERFHAFNESRASDWPHSMNASSTHDTKRGEDIRARLNVLSEIPEEWETYCKLWSKINKPDKKVVNGVNVPNRNYLYFLYQTLIGAFPFCDRNADPYRVSTCFVERIKGYITKALREGKIQSTWSRPNIPYEEAFHAFIDEILRPSDQNLFLQSFIPFQRKIAHYGIFNSLGQTLLKMTSPGVPDFYQGTELWDLNLVDPDNRRPIDFEKRKQFLLEIKRRQSQIKTLIEELLSTKEDGRIKLFLIHRGLVGRNENLDLFQRGAYIPIEAHGTLKEHVVAFARKHEGSWAISVIPRFLTSVLKEGDYPIGEKLWQETHLILPDGAPSAWRDLITTQALSGGKLLPLRSVLAHFPVSLLVSESKL